MIANNLLLDVPPGIGLLGMAAEAEGYCVVNGPDLLWGKNMRGWHPVKGAFEGVIGGPPCQEFVANLAKMVKAQGKVSSYGNLIPEFERIVFEAQPDWYLMENVRLAPIPDVPGYKVDSQLYNNRCTGEKQDRVRRFSFGTRSGATLLLDEVLFQNPIKCVTVLGADTGPRRRDGSRINYTLVEAMELQGLSRDFLDLSPFLASAKREMIGNGVPLPMGRAVFKAIRKATREVRT